MIWVLDSNELELANCRAGISKAMSDGGWGFSSPEPSWLRAWWDVWLALFFLAMGVYQAE